MNTLCKRLNDKIKGCLRPSHSDPSIHMDVRVPNDILIEILLRVAADDIINCRKVCRCWRDLISSALFVNLHVKNLSRGKDEDESIFVRSSYYGCSSGLRTFYYNISRNNKRERSSSKKFTLKVVNCSLRNSNSRKITNSCDGLLVQDDRYWLRIFNPQTGVEKKIDNYPVTICSDCCVHVCGIYFDRFRDEYKLISVAYGPSRHIDQYFFFSLSRNVWESFYRTRSTEIIPDQWSQAVIVADVMYWIGYPYDGRHCLNLVVAFDIQREQFYCLPHPPSNGACATNRERVISIIHGCMMRLIVKDGQLCFCHTLVEERIINLWILEDNANWDSWVLKYKMHLVCIDSRFRSSSVHVDDDFIISVDIVCSWRNSNEIVFTLKGGIWMYNLETHQTKSLGASSIRRSPNKTEFIVIPYNKTLLSPFV